MKRTDNSSLAGRWQTRAKLLATRVRHQNSPVTTAKFSYAWDTFKML